MTVPYTFGNESSPIPLSQLDANFAVIPAYANSAGNVTNPIQANITAVGTLTQLSVSGNTTVGNLATPGLVSATGNLYAANVSTGGNISAYGMVTAGGFQTNSTLSVLGTVTGGSFLTTGLVSATGNITGGNLSTAGQLSAGGNITTTGNIAAQGIISATGNIVTAEYFVGNFLGNITGNLSVGGSNTQVLFNLNGNVGAAGGLTYNKDSNVLTVLGQVSAQGNITGGNLSISGQSSIGGNVVLGGATQLLGLVTAPTPANATSNNQVATTAFVNSSIGTLGTMARQNATSISVTGGTIGNGIITLASISNSNIASSNISVTNITNATIANASVSNVAITNGNIVNLINPLAVADGGLGASSFAQNNVLLGNGGSPFQAVAPGTSGNVLTSDGATWSSVAVPASPGLGFGGSSWHTVSRSFNTAYVNSRSYPIAVSATATCSVTSTIQAFVNGQLIAWYQWQFNGCGSYGGTFIIVPPGATYQLNSGQGVYNWVELY